MANKYTLSNIFEYEAITTKYSVAKGSTNLDAKTLINLGLLDDNYDYARYIQFKHATQLEELIDKKVSKLGFVFSKNVINDPEYFLEYKGDYYEKIYNYYKSQVIINSSVSKIEQIINLVIRDNNMRVLYYIYFKEEEKIRKYLTRREDEINTDKKESVKNRKFFIIQ